MRLAIVEKKRCNPEKCNWLCVKLCPLNRSGAECIKKGLDKASKVGIAEALCNGCGICQARCPFSAIRIINLPERLKDEAIHRYGENAFELFGLPIAKENTVVGILGKNGIGKSTALDILSGNTIPNLGSKATKEEVIKKYAHVSLGKYFERLFSEQIKISYKPQRIELLGELYKEHKVLGLLEKLEIKNDITNSLKMLELDNLADKKIGELSGGELQRLAILATALKEADIYFFDEPMSFLDISMRIKVANFIRELAKNASVMVVEHDLASLDFISDEIQIFYGQQGCYGIVSKSKAVNRGINEYLSGFLTDDNVRFRDYEINFNMGVDEGFSKEIVFSFPEVEKSFPGFKLKTTAGELHKCETLCIMGANGLGKTTFLKLLVGLDEPDSGKIERVRIAYKPQYLVGLKGKVKDIIKIDSGWFKTILEKLELTRLLDRDVESLSGGELQKVYIAFVLSQDTDIYALDEPSAFIDVEDRLKVAEIIRDVVQKQERSAIIVDHDIQFIDYLADSMLVFIGTPGKTGLMSKYSKKDGMNAVLRMLNVTYRRDKETGRAKINKPDSLLDREQRAKGEYYQN